MKVIWLGQAGLLFESGNIKIVIDPYLSNACYKHNPANDRRMPVEKRFLDMDVDIYAVTHCHSDHLDPETMPHYLDRENSVLFLGPASVWESARKQGGNNQYVMFNRRTTWTYHGIRLTAVKAEHSDPHAIGIILDDGSKKYYITGDTLYNETVFEDIPNDIYAVFLPINGVGNNMNMIDAARFAKRTGAQKVVPLHWGLFDSIDPTEFVCDNKIIPQIYQEIDL